MKKLSKQIKMVISLFLATALFSTTVFAMEAPPMLVNNAIAIKTLTFEQAVSLAEENNNSLQDIAGNISLLLNNRNSLTYSLYRMKLEPDETLNISFSPDYITLVTSDNLNKLKSIAEVELSLETVPFQKEVTKNAIRASVLSCFIDILSSKSNLDMMNQTYRYSSQNFQAIQKKYELGMVSRVEYEKEKIKLDTMLENINILQNTYDSSCISLVKLIGLKPGTAFQISFDPVFEAMAKEFDLEAFVAQKIEDSPNIKILELTAENSSLFMNAYADDGSDDSTLKRETAKLQKERAVKDAKTNLQKSIEATVEQMEALEKTIEENTLALEQAQKEYETARLNYELGHITNLTLGMAYVGVLNAKTELHNNQLTHYKNRLNLEYMN